MVKIDAFSEGNLWLSGSKEGWQPRGRRFKLSWGQSCLLVEMWVWGLCEIGDKRLRRCSIIFLNTKKNSKKQKKKLWSMAIVSRMIAHVPNPVIAPPKFLWAFHHSFNESLPVKKIFFDPPKNFFWPNFFFLFFSKIHY